MSSSDKLRGIIHCHSHHSFDSLIPARSYLRAAERFELDFVILADHDTTAGSIELSRRVEQKSLGLQVPIAAEYCTDHGDVIAVFLKEEIRSRKIEEFFHEAREQGALLLLPHPYIAHSDVPLLAEECDLIEIYNARASRAANESAAQLAIDHRKPVYAASDAHFTRSIGSVVVQVPRRESLRESLLQGASNWTAQPTPKWETGASQLIKAFKRRDAKLAAKQIASATRYLYRRIETLGS